MTGTGSPGDRSGRARDRTQGDAADRVPDVVENREVHPADGAEVDESLERADRIGAHRRPAVDDQGIADDVSHGDSPGRAPSW
jgi:hypothetical protein